MNIFWGPRDAELHLHPSFTSSGELLSSVVTLLPWSLGTIDTSTSSLTSSAPKLLQDFSHFIDFGVSHNSWFSGFVGRRLDAEVISEFSADF